MYLPVVLNQSRFGGAQHFGSVVGASPKFHVASKILVEVQV